MRFILSFYVFADIFCLYTVHQGHHEKDPPIKSSQKFGKINFLPLLIIRFNFSADEITKNTQTKLQYSRCNRRKQSG